MKRIFLILTLFLILINGVVFAASNTTKKDISVTASDGFTLKATLQYPKIKGKKEYSTVVLLHSLGYNSQWWGNLPSDLLSRGYAIVMIDLRGHGTSVYNSKLVRTSWKNMTNTAYSKYPTDVIKILDTIKTENPKKSFFDNWVIVGSDIGANTAILVADKIAYKPKTLVVLSPTVDARGLYVPIKLANLDNIDIFSITGTNDLSGQKSQNYLKKFAQATFATYVSEAKTNGMMMLRSDMTLSKIIISWINEYIKP